MMIGNEVLTTVPARIETNMPRRRPDRASSTWRLVMEPSAVMARFGAVVVRERRDMDLQLGN
jgi:hypothetical protein